MNDSPIPARGAGPNNLSGKNSSIPASSLDYYDRPSPNEIMTTNSNSQENGSGAAYNNLSRSSGSKKLNFYQRM